MKKLFASAAVLVCLTGVAAAQPYPPPPALYQEVVPVRPGPRYVWEPGHWHWNGYSYVWIRGHYIIAHPRPMQWVHGHWAQGPGGWVWVPGGWR